jgi:hypothetical protein
MAPEIPKILYRYVDANSLDYYIKDKTFRFCPVSSLNDVHEFLWDVSPDRVVAKQKALKDLEYMWCNTSLFNRFRTLQEFKEDAGFGKQLALNDALVFRSLVDFKLKRLGVLCLTANSNSTLMWAHYADKFKGVCLGFDSRAQVFKSSHFGSLSGIVEVDYFDGPRQQKKPTGDLAHVRRAATIKSREWEYEREFRCFRDLGTSFDGIYKKFQVSDLKEVILGPRMSLDKMEEWLHVVESRFPKAVVKVAYPRADRYEMTIGQISNLRALRKVSEYCLGDLISGAHPISPEDL